MTLFCALKNDAGNRASREHLSCCFLLFFSSHSRSAPAQDDVVFGRDDLFGVLAEHNSSGLRNLGYLLWSPVLEGPASHLTTKLHSASVIPTTLNFPPKKERKDDRRRRHKVEPRITITPAKSARASARLRLPPP